MNDDNRDSESSNPSTDELLQSLQGGDLNSWSSLDRRYRTRLTRLLHGRIPSDMRARFGTDDVVQSALFAAFSKLDQFQPKKEDGFRLWIGQILRNRLRTRIRFHRAQRRDASIEDGTLNESVQGHAPSSDTQQAADQITQAIENLCQLPESDQAFLRMRFFERASFSKIATTMGISESKARRKVTSLLITLRERN